MSNPIFTITMENGGVMQGELYPDLAPQSVYNFISLANQGFYDGLIFHRVIRDFMIQGGDPTGTGMGGPGYCIKGEFLFNGVDNPTKHKRGVLSMARSSSPNSAGSQFFLMHKDAPHLDKQYRPSARSPRALRSLTPLPRSKSIAATGPLRTRGSPPSASIQRASSIPSPKSSRIPTAASDARGANHIIPRHVPMAPKRGCTGFDGGSEAGTAGGGA